MQPYGSRGGANLFPYNLTLRPPLFDELLLLLSPTLTLVATRKVFKATVDCKTARTSAGGHEAKICPVKVEVIEILIKAQSTILSDNQA